MARLMRTFLAPHWVSAFSAAGSATGTLAWPRQAIALRFLLPITAPMPVRPAAREPMLRMQAYLTRFSPARPIAISWSLSSPRSASIRSWRSPVPMPQ